MFFAYWWNIRPAHIKSECSEIAFLRAKSYSLSFYNTYISSVTTPTYAGYNNYLKKQYETDKSFQSLSYDDKDYNFDYSRCLHEYGL